jgi:hypothetical protein
VHLPCTLIRILAFSRSLPFHASNGVSIWRRLESAATTTGPAPSRGGWYVSSPASKPLAGSSSPVGGVRATSWPLAPTSVSTAGLKVRSPAIANAVTSSGDVTNACVAGLASLRAAKLRL